MAADAGRMPRHAARRAAAAAAPIGARPAHPPPPRRPNAHRRPQAWWLKALLAMAVVGVVLLDVYLLEAVLDRVRARDDAPAGLKAAGAAATAAASLHAPAGAGAGRSASASMLAAVRGSGGGGRLLVLKQLAHSALAIVPRGASDSAAQAAAVGDDGGGGTAAAAAAAGPGSSGGRRARRGIGAGAATLRLLDGLLPSRREQHAAQQQREWQRLRQRYAAPEQGRDAARWRGAAGAPQRPLLPASLRLPQPRDLPRLRPYAPGPNATVGAPGGAFAAAAAAAPLLPGPLPFVGLRGYRRPQAQDEVDSNSGGEDGLPPGEQARRAATRVSAHQDGPPTADSTPHRPPCPPPLTRL
jgi:hypothetical protein